MLVIWFVCDVCGCCLILILVYLIGVLVTGLLGLYCVVGWFVMNVVGDSYVVVVVV